MQLTPILGEDVTVQQYLEAETRRQAQSIKVKQSLLTAHTFDAVPCPLQKVLWLRDFTWLQLKAIKY